MKTLFQIAIFLALPCLSAAQFNMFHGIVNKCKIGFHKEPLICTSDIKSCPVTNGTGTQTWNGSDYGACAIASCNSGYHISGSSCVPDDACAGSPSRGAICANGTIYVATHNGRKYFIPTLAAASAAGYSGMYNSDVFSWGRQRSTGCSDNALYASSGFPPADGLTVRKSYQACRNGSPNGWPGIMDVCTDGGFHGKTDWFVPTKSEFYAMFYGQNNSVLTASGAGGFGGEYWVADLSSATWPSSTGFSAVTITWDWFYHFYTQRWYGFCVRRE